MSLAAGYAESGRAQVNRPSMLLLHGIGGGQAIWRDTLPALAQAGWHARAIDFPGYGLSPGQPTRAAMAEAVASHLVDLASGAGVVLIGHSMGGMVAQELLATLPDAAARVSGLVLACTSAAFGPDDGDWQAHFIAERLAPLDAGLGMAGMAAQVLAGMVSPQARAGALEAAAAVMAGVPEASYRVALASIVAFDRRAELPQIKLPTLMLAGEHDRTAPAALMQRMAQRVPGAEYHCLLGAGHVANVEQPAAFNAALLDFLQRRMASA